MTTATRSRLTLPERVLYAAEVEPVTRGGVVSGLQGRAVPYAVWTNRGFFMESVAAGAFDKSISEAAAGLPLLLFHDDERMPIGLSREWISRPEALYGDWSLDEGEEAQRAGALARDGLLGWFSVGHMPIRSSWDYVAADAWDPDKGPAFMDHVTRIESRLVETSLVSTPAFASARVLETYARTSVARSPGATATPRLAAWRRWRATLGD